nr:MAG TPA: hypothetical protein [Caudoviricetes sp.]
MLDKIILPQKRPLGSVSGQRARESDSCSIRKIRLALFYHTTNDQTKTDRW